VVSYNEEHNEANGEENRLHKHPDVLRFVRRLLSFRLRRDAAEEEGLSLDEFLRCGQVQWHGVKLNYPD